MQNDVITSLEQVTAEWLTAVLAQSHALSHGSVAAFDVDTSRGNWSSNATLTLQYAAGSQGSLPPRLFLKMVNTDLNDEFFGESEVTYYTRDYVGVADAPLIRCYHAVYSEAQRRYHLLLDDLSQTHIQAASKTPTLEYGLALAEGLAALHAHWWGAERLVEAGAPMHTAAYIRRFVNIAEPGVGHILQHCAADLEPHWPELIHDFYANHLQAMIGRAQYANGFTLIHGDAGCWNILVPRDKERPIYVIDRQPFDWSLTTWLGVYDVVYAIVLDWEVELRRQMEIPILEHYHQHLLRRGVANYPWEQLWDDYRLCVAMGIYIATEYCRGGLNQPVQWVWLPMLQRSLAACDDLDCRTLW